MKLQVLLYHPHTPNNLTPTLTTLFLKSVFGTKVQAHFIPVHPSTYTLESPFPAPYYGRVFPSKTLRNVQAYAGAKVKGGGVIPESGCEVGVAWV